MPCWFGRILKGRLQCVQLLRFDRRSRTSSRVNGRTVRVKTSIFKTQIKFINLNDNNFYQVKRGIIIENHLLPAPGPCGPTSVGDEPLGSKQSSSLPLFEAVRSWPIMAAADCPLRCPPNVPGDGDRMALPWSVSDIDECRSSVRCSSIGPTFAQ